MKRYISEKEEKYYTHMLKVLNSIGGRNLDYNWLIADIEAYPQDDGELDKLIRENDYLFLSNDELISMLEKNDFQWIWGVFSAMPNKYTKEEVLKYELPFADGNYDIYKEDLFVIQHPLADIEIVAFDSSCVQIVAKDEEIANKFKNLYKNVKVNY